MERRGSGFIRNEGEAECLRGVEIAQRYYLDRPYNGAPPDGAELEEFERSERRLTRARSALDA
jgi:hypothetical protein